MGLARLLAQADHPMPGLSKKSNSGGFGGAQSSPAEMGVFAPQHRQPCGVIAGAEKRRMTQTALKPSTPLVWHREDAVPAASCWGVHNHRAIRPS